MHILPLQVVLVLRLAFDSRMSYADDAFGCEVFRVTEKEAEHIVRRLPVRHKAVAYLAPARAKT